MDADEQHLREIFDGTQVLRRPVRGVVVDYHELPYKLIGPIEGGSVEIAGRVRVSPRLVIPMRQLVEKFGDLFGDDGGYMDQQIVGRSFQFAVARDPSKQIRHEHLHIEPSGVDWQTRLGEAEDALARAEDTRTALVSCPEPRFYPISLDRFIREMLEQEFRG